MDIGSIFLILSILLLVSLFISQPLIRKEAILVSDDEQEYSKLLADRDRILNTLQDLDFDYLLGKIPEERYPSERAELLQKGAIILRKMDKFQDKRLQDGVNMDLVENLTGRNNEILTSQAPVTTDDQLEALIAKRVRDREEKSNGFCPQCGHAVQKSDHFCPRCGYSLKSSN